LIYSAATRHTYPFYRRLRRTKVQLTAVRGSYWNSLLPRGVLLQIIEQAGRQNLSSCRQRCVVCGGSASQVSRGFGEVGPY